MIISYYADYHICIYSMKNKIWSSWKGSCFLIHAHLKIQCFEFVSNVNRAESQ